MREYAAPAASLLAVTAAVLGIHYGLQTHRHAPPPPAVVHLGKHLHVTRTAVFKQFYVVQRGDSFSTIAVKTKTSIPRLEQLNPKVSPTALHVGQRIRVK